MPPPSTRNQRSPKPSVAAALKPWQERTAARQDKEAAATTKAKADTFSNNVAASNVMKKAEGVRKAGLFKSMYEQGEEKPEVPATVKPAVRRRGAAVRVMRNDGTAKPSGAVTSMLGKVVK